MIPKAPLSTSPLQMCSRPLSSIMTTTASPKNDDSSLEISPQIVLEGVFSM